MIIELLRPLCITFGRIITTITERDNHETGAIKHDTRTEMLASTRLRQHLKQHLHIGHRGRIMGAAKFAARDFGTVAAGHTGIV